MCIPTDDQIIMADKIASMLNIDFPTGSADFSKEAYWQFINSHWDAYKSKLFKISSISF